MAKKNEMNLIDEISKIDPVPASRPHSWHTKLKAEDECRYNEIVAVAKDFLSGGIVSRKFPSAVALHKFLVDKKVLEGISYQQFKALLHTLRN